MASVNVETKSRAYTVEVGAAALDSLGPFLEASFPHSKLFVICDDNTHEIFRPRLEEAAGRPLAWLRIRPGELHKNLETAGKLYQDLLDQGATRRDVVLALGGGVVGDIAGFVAATYFRGIEFIQIPTTLLAMVDSSIGGKVAVDLPGAKNAVGAFWQPSAVFAETRCLETLPDVEYPAGLAEVAKYALVFDATMADMMEREADRIMRREGEILEELIIRCVEIKAGVVTEDERDTGTRLLLNYGHTFGHGLEVASGYAHITHGQAIALGMLMAAHFSELVGLGEPGLSETHAKLEQALGLGFGGVKGVGVENILAAMQSDKKRAGSLRLVLLKKPGQPAILADPEEEDLRRSISETIAEAGN